LTHHAEYATRTAAIQIVIDTNILVSGLRSSRGAAAALLALVGT